MQALALLCTLHADGPATLRRLHRVGCTSLQRLGAYEPDELAQILEIPPAVARRLGREAGSLAERLDLRGFGDREEAPEIAVSPGSIEAPAAAAGSPGLDRRDRAVLGRVLDRWRTGTPAAGLAESEAGGVTPAEQAFLEAPPAVDPPRGMEDPEESAVVAPVAAPAEQPVVEAAEEPRLRASEIDGLDEALCLRLARVGVVDLAGLVEAEPLGLSRDLEIAYARVRRLQFLGARALPREEEPVPRPQPEVVAEGAPLPEEAPLREEAPLPEQPPLREEASPRVEPQHVEPQHVEPQHVEPQYGEAPREVLEEPVPRKFWEPRIQARDAAVPHAPERDEPEPRRAHSPREGVALNWNFELHPPAPPVERSSREPAARVSGRPQWGAGVTESEVSFTAGEEGAAGPFA